MNWPQLVEKLTIKANEYGNQYAKRLKFEISEIVKQGAESYWLGLYVSEKSFKNNPNKLIIPFLLGMVEENPFQNRKTPMLNTVKASAVYDYKEKYGFLPEDMSKDTDMPDIDIDCLPESRDPLKEYAINKYSSEFQDGYGSVCSVGTWQTYKFRSAIQDVVSALDIMTRFDAARYTTEMPDIVDELQENGRSKCKERVIADGIETECGFMHDLAICPSCGRSDTESPTLGKLIAEDSPTDNFPDGPLRTFHRLYPEVVEFAVQLVGRIRNMGMHAGALIITDRPLFGNIPLAKSSSKGFWTSMWTEGRTTQLSKFGYVKWDLLGLKTLKYIYRACQLIEENRGISFGEKNDSEFKSFNGMEYNDPQARHAGYYYDGDGNKCFIDMDDRDVLELANMQMTDGVFQFDTSLSKTALAHGVRSFEDLMLLSAMNHPGPMACVRIDSEINTEGGFKKIKDLSASDKILALSNDNRIISTDKYKLSQAENKKILKIKTKSGKEIFVSPDHKILTDNGYVRAGDLATGSKISVITASMPHRP